MRVTDTAETEFEIIVDPNAEPGDLIKAIATLLLSMFEAVSLQTKTRPFEDRANIENC